jgi:Outer membrane protein beta-barrel domain
MEMQAIAAGIVPASTGAERRRALRGRERRPLRRSLAFATVLLMAGAFARPASAGSLDLRVGGFFPRAESNLFVDDASLYTVNPKKDFDGWYGGIEYSMKIQDNLEWGIHVDGYGKHVDTFYRDYERDNGENIFQTLELDIIPVGMSLRFGPTSRRVKFAPYIAVGADAVFWQYKEYGDFVDFGDPTLPIVPDSFEASGVQPGFHGAVGFRVALSPDFFLTAEGRYLWAPLETMGEDFSPNGPGLENEIDLSGFSVTVGLRIRF